MTPHEIILQRHQSAESKLAAIRPEDLAAIARAGAQPKPGPSVAWMARQFWREALWPWRRVWTGVAGAWVVIIGLNLTAGGSSGKPAQASVWSNVQVLIAVRDQRLLLAQLLAPAAPPVTAPAAPAALPGKRSEEEATVMFG